MYKRSCDGIGRERQLKESRGGRGRSKQKKRGGRKENRALRKRERLGTVLYLKRRKQEGSYLRQNECGSLSGPAYKDWYSAK